ncbi:hypothetical protein NMY22_g6306 [Coprinellus aureogranulatus]|nr:hypothetical protein NMY22_g6306 [Coprinellus aureogranulatus]
MPRNARKQGSTESTRTSSRRPARRHGVTSRESPTTRLLHTRATHLLANIPLDILGEVLSHLAPLDVLHLARTDKYLRRLLMSRSFVSFWERARQNDEELPPCPAHLSEPQFKKWNDMPQKIDQALADFIPATSEALTASERKQSEQYASTQWRTAARTRFHVRTALELQAQYSGIKTAKQKESWLDRQRTSWNGIEEHAALCREYIEGVDPKSEEEANQFRSQRKERMLQDLRTLGYEEEFDLCGMFSPSEIPTGETMYPRIHTPRKLSEREWQTIRGPMIAYMEEVKVALAGHRRDTRIRDKIAAYLTPTYAAFIMTQPANVFALPRSDNSP